mmetsp:Transcript_7380/g.11092  ORF Transcript_7380/g.11092 Transcript_7380/m.11092 type:complete len:275 (+) Transcript_7380:26-850(+)
MSQRPHKGPIRPRRGTHLIHRQSSGPAPNGNSHQPVLRRRRNADRCTGNSSAGCAPRSRCPGPPRSAPRPHAAPAARPAAGWFPSPRAAGSPAAGTPRLGNSRGRCRSPSGRRRRTWRARRCSRRRPRTRHRRPAPRARPSPARTWTRRTCAAGARRRCPSRSGWPLRPSGPGRGWSRRGRTGPAGPGSAGSRARRSRLRPPRTQYLRRGPTQYGSQTQQHPRRSRSPSSRSRSRPGTGTPPPAHPCGSTRGLRTPRRRRPWPPTPRHSRSAGT